MTQEEFDTILIGILSEYQANQIIDIPGIYEVLAEYFNNEVLKEWEENNGVN